MRLSLSLCQRTYLRIFSSSRPTVLTQYPFAQKCRPQYLFFRSRYVSKSLIALFPFRKPTASDIEYLGGTDKTRWIWSNWTLPSTISILFHSHSCRIISRTESLSSPLRILKRYLGHQTMWHLHSHTACANFLKSCIEYLLILSRVTTWHLRRYSFFSNLYSPTYPHSIARTISLADGLWE
jgi:hypothetical protein